MTGRTERIAALAICMIGLALRTVQIDYNFDIDELFSARIAAQPFGGMIRQSLMDHPHPPLHNLLLFSWVRAFEVGEISVRSFSVLCSAAFLVVTHLLLRRLMPPGPALGALALVAVSPFFVYYGQQARPYSLIALLSAANLLALLRLLDAPAVRGRVVVWSVTCAVLAWAQYIAALTVAAEIAILLLVLPRREKVLVVVGGVLAVATVLPWLITAMGSHILHGTDPLPHIDWIKQPTPQELVWFYAGIFGDVPGIRSRWLLLPLAALGVAYYATAIRRGLSPPAFALTGIGVGVPLVVFALSAYGPKSVWAERQFMGPALAFVALVGLWAANCPRWLGRVALVGALAWLTAAVPSAFPMYTKPPWRAVAEYLDVEYPNRPVLAAEDWVADPLGYYRKAGEVVRVQDRPSGPAILLCRPGRDEGLARNSTPLRDWSWRRTRPPNDNASLRLYEVAR
ncbi:glycosyltransferase family 39 protein [Paludisphaera borealis]|uniref:Glycosyltransferase RgtA/B/C/D-like domain-containing protein n=1 Tax=Paludisphaera borealis TaxID=1387353 RepID=A0A1U7CU77_9BACT|nr:glycosyltransferase family 39 protein [Paludisphaera borealis]APW62482.1 hypothetical protein BSF38_04028 [Paludisphaera borealis]